MSTKNIITNKTGNQMIIGKAKVDETGKLSIDGKTYPVTERVQGILEKLDLSDKMAIFATNKEGEVAVVRVSGAVDLNGVEVSKFKGEGTFVTTYRAIIGTACNPKEGNPFRLSVAHYDLDENHNRKTTFTELTMWNELAERAQVECIVPDGERKPHVAVIARKLPNYRGREQWLAEDITIIP